MAFEGIPHGENEDDELDVSKDPWSYAAKGSMFSQSRSVCTQAQSGCFGGGSSPGLALAQHSR